MNAERPGGTAASPTRRPSAAPVPTWSEYLGAMGMAKALLLAGLVVWMYWDHILRLVYYWMEPDWSHGFLIPVFGLYVVNMKREQLFKAGHRGSLWGAALMAASTLVYAWAIMAKIGYPQPLSIITMIAGVVLLMCGWRVLWLTLFPICFLGLGMPPPDRMYRAFTQPLQQFAATVSTAVLNMFPGAETERSGVNISYWVEGHGSGMFAVAGACSGMRSLMAFVALGLMTAYFTPRPMWQRLAMAVSVVPVALLCNVLRVIVTGAFQMYGHKDLAEGTPHAILGMITFAIGFMIYMGILWILDHVYVEGPTEEKEAME
jgi:exosortase